MAQYEEEDFKPEVRLHEADVQQLLVIKEEDPHEQQEWSPSLEKEDLEPPFIKEEQGELWTNQEGEQLQGLEEADIIKFTFTADSVKSEDDDEEEEASQLHQRQTEQMKTEADEEDFVGPEPARNSDPDGHLQPDTDDKTEDSSEPETDNSDDWVEDTRKSQSGLNSMKNNVPVSDVGCSTAKKSFTCSECGKVKAKAAKAVPGNVPDFDREWKKSCAEADEEKPFSCSECSKTFTDRVHLQNHTTVHIGGKPFSCSVCGKSFIQKYYLQNHMRVHTGEKPFSCSVCSKRYKEMGSLLKHIRTHTGEKPFSCLVCGKRFSQKDKLQTHIRIHTGEKPFSCSVCSKSFNRMHHLQNHMTTHTGEKPFSCSVCSKSFARKDNLEKHMRIHTRKQQLEMPQKMPRRLLPRSFSAVSSHGFPLIMVTPATVVLSVTP